jgi:transposase
VLSLGVIGTAAGYFDLVRELKNPYNHRLRLVESAKQRGIKPTARLFGTTVPTVRKWLRRFQQHGSSALVALPRVRHHQSQKTPPATEAQLVELRKTLPTFGSRRLIREFDLPISHCALERIWREHGLPKKRRRKYQRKQDLAHIKAQWAYSSKSARIPRIQDGTNKMTLPSLSHADLLRRCWRR